MKRYAIKKDGIYLSELFTDPIKFKAKDLKRSYLYDNRQIAEDIAGKEGATVEEV